MESSLEKLREDRKVMKNTHDNPLTSQSLKNSLKIGLDKIDKLISEREKEESDKKETIAKTVKDFLSGIKAKTEKRQFLEYLISTLKKEYKGLTRRAEFGIMLDKEFAKGGEIGFKEWESTVLSDVMDKGSMGKPRAIQAIDMYEDEFIPLKECYYTHEKSPEQVAQEIIDYTFDEIPDEELEEDEFKRGGKTKHIGFKGLAAKVAKEYRKKGYSDKEAKAFGKDTAGKIRWAKENKAEKGAKIGFKKLAHKVEREYENEGFSTKRAKEIGIKTAAKIKREKEAKAIRGKHLTSKQKYYADKLMRHGTKEYIALAKAKNKR